VAGFGAELMLSHAARAIVPASSNDAVNHGDGRIFSSSLLVPARLPRPLDS